MLESRRNSLEAGRGKLTLGDLLALVDLGDLLVEELVTLLTDLDDLLSLEAKGYIQMSDGRGNRRIYAP